MLCIRTASGRFIFRTMPDSLYRPFPLGSTILKGNLFLGPMAGYTDRSFRSLCTECGASMTCTEMVSAEGLVRDSKNTFSLLLRAPNEEHLAVQLFGSDPDTMARAAEQLPANQFCAIDINFGCPVPKVVKTGAGSALLRSPQAINNIIKAVRNASGLPVTAKIRLGWDSNSINYDETAQAASEGGAAAVCLHCRTRAQFYTGEPDYQALSKLKQLVNIPVIGSGDVFSPEDAQRILSDTHCDGVMFARGAIGRPFVFKETIELLSTGAYNPVPLRIKIDFFLRQLEMLSADRGERTACREMRKHVPYLLKGIRNSASVRQAASTAETEEEYRSALSSILDQFPV
jgi:tRNA-dihydrouridine synthase B